MTLNPKLAKFETEMRARGAKSLHEMSPQEARAFVASLPRSPVKNKVPTIEKRVGNFRVRIYRPEAKEPLPILVFFHGGGWVLGDLDSVDARCHLIARGVPCILISIDYRLAPEHPFPTPFDDAYEATRWVHNHAKELGGDPEKIAVGGESSGGNLAAAVALKARDEKSLPLAFQWLIYPVCDANFETPSYHAFSEGYFLEKEAMIWCWNLYLPDLEGRKNPYACPLHAKTLQRLPPAYIATAECDVLRDEAEAYAARMRADGVAVHLQRFTGLDHSFLLWIDLIAEAKQAFLEMIEALRQGFAKSKK